MGLQWINESNPVWDEGKQRIVGKAPAGIFDRRDAELESDQLVQSLRTRGVCCGSRYRDDAGFHPSTLSL